ncbi:hypothetical protein PF005_g5574 [Phytophthora fragariae]|uniref:Uncharacterized protein n=1 Tax=Phytophthora fragariae TaxID=53985 RepID=A0A6A3UJR2_9STRA|nr:hypothetical protein PF003_g2391 [Phytophthora fragariae]KAE8944255.1 hypothetical protein PF009_g6078 [Phytophthora fragariae]KAE9022349.1 hypothetical protein PF011_g4527 [Phytophthora fragariae]KAE9127394.1 hypothetical protein PF007_g5632 [Phytophthora fragariae]KAE9127715.1 hypothetical protein PF010_g4781 [Phytophthora fragariae]
MIALLSILGGHQISAYPNDICRRPVSRKISPCGPVTASNAGYNILCYKDLARCGQQIRSSYSS